MVMYTGSSLNQIRMLRLAWLLQLLVSAVATDEVTSESSGLRQNKLLDRLRQLLQNVTSEAPPAPVNNTPLPRHTLRDIMQLFRILSPGGNKSSSGDLDLSALMPNSGQAGRTGVVILAYSLIMLVSLFGNLLVCQVVLKNKRLHTVTNIFIANLAVSDVLMTCLNIPFNISRLLLDDWPFGSFMCAVVPFVQVCAVYVSAFTMVAIALDRYQVIVTPLKPRLRTRHGVAVVVLVWLLAGGVSLPHAVYNRLVSVFTYRALTRCQTRYPPPARQFRKWLTLATSISQYYLPLLVTGFAYLVITRKVWSRSVLGAITEEQLVMQTRAKRKTIKMLMVVVVLFAICWMPLNMYHLIVDFSEAIGPTRHSSTLFFVCHWLAMSNVCYNPFIYCWLNEHFRAGALSWLKWVARRSSKVHPAIEINGVLVQTARRRRVAGGDTASTNTLSTSLRADSARRPLRPERHEVMLNGFLEVRSPDVLASLFSRASAGGVPAEVRQDGPQLPTGDPLESGFPLLPRLCERGDGQPDAYDVICRNIEIVYRRQEENRRRREPAVRHNRSVNRCPSTRRVSPTDRFNISIYGKQAAPDADRANVELLLGDRMYRGDISGLLRDVTVCGNEPTPAEDCNELADICETSFQNDRTTPPLPQAKRKMSSVSHRSV